MAVSRKSEYKRIARKFDNCQSTKDIQNELETFKRGVIYQSSNNHKIVPSMQEIDFILIFVA